MPSRRPPRPPPSPPPAKRALVSGTMPGPPLPPPSPPPISPPPTASNPPDGVKTMERDAFGPLDSVLMAQLGHLAQEQIRKARLFRPYKLTGLQIKMAQENGWPLNPNAPWYECPSRADWARYKRWAAAVWPGHRVADGPGYGPPMLAVWGSAPQDHGRTYDERWFRTGS